MDGRKEHALDAQIRNNRTDASEPSRQANAQGIRTAHGASDTYLHPHTGYGTKGNPHRLAKMRRERLSCKRCILVETASGQKKGAV
jgi:hypothetical protein